MAMQARCFIPPESSCGYISATSGGRPTWPSRSRTRAVTVALRQVGAVIAQRIGDLRADAQHGVERVHRALRHQRDTGQPQPPHRIVRQRGQRQVVQPHLAAIDVSRRTDQAQDGERHGRFAGTRFAGQAEALVAGAG